MRNTKPPPKRTALVVLPFRAKAEVFHFRPQCESSAAVEPDVTTPGPKEEA
jgi:hypothetical protein